MSASTLTQEPLHCPRLHPSAGAAETVAAVLSFAGLLGGIVAGLTVYWRWLVGGIGLFLAAGCIGLFLAGRRVEPQVSAVETQLSARGAIPPEVWGTDTERRAVAQELMQQPWIPWCSRNFIPADPFRVVVGADLEGEYPSEISVQFLGAMLGEELTLRQAERLLKMTLGEVVDHFVEVRARSR